MRESVDEVISVESLSKTFGDLVAVDDISFSVRRGEVFGILGPNGAGKTTTLECIEGLQEPSSGKITVLGTEVARDPNTVKERIGVQLQASAYFDYLTLTEILELFGLFYSRRVPAAELLSTVGLEDKANTTVGKLSGSPSPPRWSTTRRSCSSTSQPPVSTPRPAATCGTSCRASVPRAAPSY